MRNKEDHNANNKTSEERNDKRNSVPFLLGLFVITLYLGIIYGIFSGISDIVNALSYKNGFIILVICEYSISIGINVAILYAKDNFNKKAFDFWVVMLCVISFIYMFIYSVPVNMNTYIQLLRLIINLMWLAYVLTSDKVRCYFEEGAMFFGHSQDRDYGSDDAAINILKQESKIRIENDLITSAKEPFHESANVDPIILSHQPIEEKIIKNEEKTISENQDITGSKVVLSQDFNKDGHHNISKVIVIAVVIMMVLCIATLSVTSIYMILQNKSLQEKNTLLVGANESISKENEELQSEISEKEALNAELEEKLEDKESDLKEKSKEVGDYQTENTKMTDVMNNLKKFGKTDYIGTSSYYSNQYIIVTTGDEREIQVTFTLYGSVYCQGNNGNINVDWVGEFDSYNHCKVKFTPIFEGCTTFTFTNDQNSASFEVLVIYIKYYLYC
ncbi:hypothetical protein WAA20_12285 [Butyrivibrio fibrisolvens]|nr:hypothetical protein [Butyrivibrio fibrisolvens]